MSLKAVSVRYNDTQPHVDSIIYNNNILLKVSDTPTYRIKNISFGGGVTKLSQLSDVLSVNPQQDDVLIYDTSVNKYVNNKLNLDFGEY